MCKVWQVVDFAEYLLRKVAGTKNLKGVVDQEQVVSKEGRHHVARQPRNADVLGEHQKDQETYAEHHSNVASRTVALAIGTIGCAIIFLKYNYFNMGGQLATYKRLRHRPPRALRYSATSTRH